MTDTAKRGATQLAVREQEGQEVVKLKVPPTLNESNNLWMLVM